MKNTFDFNFKIGEFIMKNGNPMVLSDVNALKQWIRKVLHTQLNRYSIYRGTTYGANIEDLVIGKSYTIDFAESELKREIENALLQNDDIESITSFSLTKKGETLLIEFNLKTSYGAVTDNIRF